MKFIISRNVGWEITYVKRRSRITRKNQRRNRLIEVKNERNTYKQKGKQ